MSKPLATATDAHTIIAFAAHDHRHCVQEALRAAREACRTRGARLTQLREEVLRLVWQSHRPIGAYALLELLGSRGDTRRLAGPPTVYRALEFLSEQGFVHRVESLNAYIGCQIGAEPHDHQLYICRACGTAQESAQSAIRHAVEDYASGVDFAVESVSLEVVGLCPACAAKSAA